MDISFSHRFTLITSVTCLIAISLPLAKSLYQNPTAYEVLQSYDFPMGLLPKGVTGYDLDVSTGKFSAFLNDTCSFSLEGSYRLKYSPSIRGYISRGKLSTLEGVSVKLLWMWVNIAEVYKSGNDLEFSVGIASAGFPLDSFFESPQCGCGLNCNDGQMRMVRTDLFVSSN